LSSTSPPVFILGAPRSGTSLLYKVLALHPEAAWISNWMRRAPALPALAVLNRVAAAAPRTRHRVWFGAEGSNAYVYGRRRSVADRLFPQPVEGEPLFERAGVPEQSDATTATPRQLRLRRSFEVLRRASGGRAVVSKRIGHNTRVPLLRAIFPEARFVAITRDGRAVALSLSRVDWWEDGPVWWYGDTPRAWAAEGRDPLEMCARHWVEEVGAIEKGLAGVPADQVLRVRYEDLVDAPRTLLAEVTGFAGLGPSTSFQTALDAVRFPNQNTGWEEGLGDHAGRVYDIQQARLREHGYVS
jgi:Sulfotransferase family